jgi:NADP-dependent 3-hydroxy acid dehydrogenase YdfG
MMPNIEGKVVVIMGASSGLGEATARHLNALGAKVVLGARRLDRLQAIAKDLALGADRVAPTDVTNREQVKALADHAWRGFAKRPPRLFTGAAAVIVR